MLENELTFERILGETPDEKAAYYARRVNEEYAKEEIRYSKIYEEMLPFMVLDYFTTDIDGVKYLGILRGISRHSTKKEFMPAEENTIDQDGDN